MTQANGVECWPCFNPACVCVCSSRFGLPELLRVGGFFQSLYPNCSKHLSVYPFLQCALQLSLVMEAMHNKVGHDCEFLSWTIHALVMERRVSGWRGGSSFHALASNGKARVWLVKGAVASSDRDWAEHRVDLYANGVDSFNAMVGCCCAVMQRRRRGQHLVLSFCRGTEEAALRPCPPGCPSPP